MVCALIVGPKGTERGSKSLLLISNEVLGESAPRGGEDSCKGCSVLLQALWLLAGLRA